MKKVLLISTLLATGTGLWAQGMGIQAILGRIADNNKQLQSIEQRATSEKMTNRSENNLPNPNVSYSHVWDSKDKNITAGELIVSQGFDFPTLYATRGKMNRARNLAVDASALAMRQDILLQAKELCLDIITLHRQQQLLNERLANAEELAVLYKKRLDAGDANAIETNKINLELLNVRTEVRLNETALHGAVKQLMALNDNRPMVTGGRPLPGNKPVSPAVLGLTEMDITPLPTDFHAEINTLLDADASLRAIESTRTAADRSLSANRQGWLPSLELGYRRNTDSGHPMNGMVVGFSVPLFQNIGKVKAAKAEKLGAELEYDAVRMQTEASLWQLYDEAQQLQTSIREYKETLGVQQDFHLLQQALTSGEMSIIEYFVEVQSVYQSHSNLIQLENQYEKAMAKIYKSRL